MDQHRPLAKRRHPEEAIGLVTLTTTLAYFDTCSAFQYPWLRHSTCCLEPHDERATSGHKELVFSFFHLDPPPHLASLLCFLPARPAPTSPPPLRLLFPLSPTRSAG